MKKIVIKEFDDKEDAVEYWKNKTPEERLDAVELLREQYYVIQGLRSVPRIKRCVNLVDRFHVE
jgi:hypothetical protein